MAASLDAELAFLLEEKEVPSTVLEKLQESGMTSLSRFVLMAATHDEWRHIVKDDWGIDPSGSRQNRLALACVLDAWDDAKVRRQKEQEAEAESRRNGLPKALGKRPHQLARKAVEAKFYKFADQEVPAPCLVDVILAQLEGIFVVCIPLTDAIALTEVDDDPEFGIAWSKTGAMKMKKATQHVPLPKDSEELRWRLHLWTVGHAFAFVRMPGRVWLQSATPTVSTTYAGYLLGDKVRTLGSSTEGGGADPSWAQILRYDKEIRKKQAKLINEEGQTFEGALVAACKDTEIREMFLTGPTVQSAVLAKAPPPANHFGDRERTPRNPGAFSPWGKGKGKDFNKGKSFYKGDWWNKGKDKGGSWWGKGRDKGGNKGGNQGVAGKGRGTGFVRNLLSHTPDGRQICFNFNTPQGCDDRCGRVHVCRRCLKDTHGVHEDKCSS